MGGYNHNGSGLVKGFLIGGALGALAAILLAPKSGKELRSDIKEKGNDALDGARRLCSDVQREAKALFEGAKSGVQDLTRNLSF
jgi:gas vesicle protein